MIFMLDKKFTINKEKVSYRFINDEAVILHLEKGFYYSLNKTGSLIWQLIERGKNIKEIIQHLSKEFNLKEKDLSQDVASLIADMEKEGLIDSAGKG